MRFCVHEVLAHIFSIAGEVLIAVVLGVMWMKNLPEIKPRYHFFDLFCGDAKASSVWPLGSFSTPRAILILDGHEVVLREVNLLGDTAVLLTGNLMGTLWPCMTSS